MKGYGIGIVMALEHQLAAATMLWLGVSSVMDIRFLSLGQPCRGYALT